MLNSQKRIFIVLFILLLFITCNFFIINTINLYFTSVIFLLITLFVVYFIGYEKDKFPYKKNLCMSMFVYASIYQIITYLVGIIVGFLNSSYSVTLFGIISNILPVTLFIIISEIMRYTINKKIKSKYLFVLSIFTFIVIDLLVNSYRFDFTSIESLLIILTVILPSLFKNLLFTYSSYNYGYLPNIIFRLILQIPLYLIPIIPNINEYVESVMIILLSIIVLLKCTNKSKTTNDFSINRNKKHNIVYTIVIIWLLVVVYLNSGYFNYYALTIGSESMENELTKGDIVIINKTDEDEILKINVGDIIVYNYNDKVIVHRVYETDEDRSYFITKGDNNEDPDNWIVTSGDIIGVVKFKIKYLGLPTIYFNEIYN